MSGNRLPVTVVTGFLGSGKTTLLTGLLRRRRHRRLALLINEFGEISVDGALLRSGAGGTDSPEVSIVELSHGLIAYGDDTRFMVAMQAIAAQRAMFDHVLIETSGLALPSAVMELLQGPLLADDFILDATLAVVDTPLLLASGPGAPSVSGADAGAASSLPSHSAADASAALLFARQLALADVVVLNKIDALDETALLRAEALVRDCAPNVRFLELAYQAELDLRVALGLRLHQIAGNAAAHAVGHDAAHTAEAHGRRLTYSQVGQTDLAGQAGRIDPADAAGGTAPTTTPADAEAAATALPAPALNQRPFNGHAHSGMGAHRHGLATHRHFHEQDPGWLSFTLRSDAMQPLPLLQQALTEAARREPVLRRKGDVSAAGRAQPVLVQGVRTRITLAAEETPRRHSGNSDSGDGNDNGNNSHNSNNVNDRNSDNAGNTPLPQRHRSELVFIGYHLSRARVARLLSGMTATEWR